MISSPGSGWTLSSANVPRDVCVPSPTMVEARMAPAD
jgi:hypothetical protein